jgi:Flp pilus assembly protein TadG
MHMNKMLFAFASMRRVPARLARDNSGLALLEFAFSLPLVLMIGLYGVETANQALINLKISQIALSLADNASRVGLIGNANSEQLREIDINDVLQAARDQGSSIELTTRGRITLSSLEKTKAGVQSVHWQRCIGQKSGAGYDAPAVYATTSTAGTDTTIGNAGTLAPTGMVDLNDPNNGGAAVNAPTDGGVMFVEVNYMYKPIVGQWLFGTARIHYIASFIVRDNRVFDQIYNPAPAVSVANKMTCDKYPA